MNLATLALLLAQSLGHTGVEAREIANSLASACRDAACVVDGAVYLEHESGWQLQPRAYSDDAKIGLSVGPFQVQGAGVRLENQAARWVALRDASLTRCGDLTALASGRCRYGLRLVRARALEAYWLAQLIAGEEP